MSQLNTCWNFVFIFLNCEGSVIVENSGTDCKGYYLVMSQYLTVLEATLKDMTKAM